jgi:hypothetical protein
MGKLASGLIHHRVEVRVEIPENIERAPTGLIEGEEEVKGGFFPTIRAKNTIVVIFF